MRSLSPRGLANMRSPAVDRGLITLYRASICLSKSFVLLLASYLRDAGRGLHLTCEMPV